MAGMISPERNWAPKLGAFPAGLLLRISVRPGRAVQDDGVHGECPKDGDCGAKLPAHPQRDGGFDGHCNQDGSPMPRGDDGLRVARRGSETTVTDLGKSEAGWCSHPASLFLAYLLTAALGSSSTSFGAVRSISSSGTTLDFVMWR